MKIANAFSILVLGVFGIPVLYLLFTIANIAYWDSRVRNMCLKDGGVTVYERVQLTLEEYRRFGGIEGRIVVPNENSSVADQYEYLNRSVTTVIESQDVLVRRFETEFYRISNGKVLAKIVLYSRSGGDAVALGPETSFGCNDIRGFNSDVIGNTFSIRGE